MVKRAKAAASQLLVETDELPPPGFVVPNDKVITYLDTKTSPSKSTTQLELIMSKSDIQVVENYGIDTLKSVFAEVSDVRVTHPAPGTYEGTVLVYGTQTGTSKLATYIAYLLAVANNVKREALTLKLTTYRLQVAAKEVPQIESPTPGLTIDADTIFDTESPVTVIDVSGDFSNLFTFLTTVRHASYKLPTIFGVHVDSVLYQRSPDLQTKFEALRKLV